MDAGYTAIAFNPTQIKSAIGNNGQFDPENPDIRYSASNPGPAVNVANLLRMLGDSHSPKARAQVVSSVQATVDAIRGAWANAPEVIVAYDMGDPVVPEAARRADLKQRSGGARGAPEGFYYKGKVYLMAARLMTPNDAARVLFHESLGHHGLRGAFGKDLDKILDQIATMRKADVDAKIKEYGLRGVKRLSRRTAAEEVLAEMAQSTPDLHFVKRAISAIRNWLRAHVPGFKSLRMTDNDIIQAFILPARAWVERGGSDGGGPRGKLDFSRSASTKEAYEARIDALFAGDPAAGPRKGVKVLDKSDVLALLGFGDGPLHLAEGKVIKGMENHPRMTADQWKKVPDWLENPAAVFDSETVNGALVLIAPETINGATVRMTIEPRADGGKDVHILTNAYDAPGKTPFARWLQSGLGRLVDQKVFPAVLERSGLQLSSSAWQNKPGTKKILTEKHLAGYRRVQGSNANQADEGVDFSRAKIDVVKVSASKQGKQLFAWRKNGAQRVLVQPGSNRLGIAELCRACEVSLHPNAHRQKKLDQILNQTHLG